MLKEKIKSIRTWMEMNHKEKAPNMNEIVGLYIELGKEAVKRNVAGEASKYPTDMDLIDAYYEMDLLINNRRLDPVSIGEVKNSLFTLDDPLITLLYEIRRVTLTGAYITFEERPKAQHLKDTLLKKIMTVGTYLRQQERDKNEEVTYDNIDEMTELEALYEIYMTRFKTTDTNREETVPQFGFQMRPVMNEIRDKFDKHLEQEKTK